MRIWIVEAEHKHEPGKQITAHSTRQKAEQHKRSLRAAFKRQLEYCDLYPLAVDA